MCGELTDVQAGFRKGRETRDQLPTYTGSQKKQENSRKTSTSASLITLKPLIVMGRSDGEGICYPFQYSWASLVAQMVKNPPAMWETWVQSMG